VVKEALLERDAVAGVKLRPMLQPVNLQPLLLGGGPHEPFNVATEMESLPSPVGRGEQGDGDLGPFRRSPPVVFAVGSGQDKALIIQL